MYTRNTRWILALAVAAALAAVPGCGGGGGGGGGGQGSHFPPPTTTLRPLQNGDEWDYVVTGTATAPGQKSSTVTGKITRTVNAPTAGLPDTTDRYIQEVAQYTLSGGGLIGPAGGTTDTFFTQDASGNIIELGQFSQTGIVTQTLTVNNPTVANATIIPGAWAQGNTTNTNLTYTQGGGLTQAFAIGAAGGVTVPAGNFSIWNTSVSVDGGTALPETWDPTLGSYVTNTFAFAAPSGGITWTVTINAKLHDSTVAG